MQSIWRRGEGPRIRELATKIEPAQESEDFPQTNRLRGVKSSCESKLCAWVENQLRTLAPGMRWGQQENFMHRGKYHPAVPNPMARYFPCCLNVSRISFNNTSVGVGAGAAVPVSPCFSNLRRRVLMPFTIRKMQNATRMKSKTFCRKLP